VPTGGIQYLNGVENLEAGHHIGWRGAPNERKLGKSPQNESPDGLIWSFIIGH